VVSKVYPPVEGKINGTSGIVFVTAPADAANFGIAFACYGTVAYDEILWSTVFVLRRACINIYVTVRRQIGVFLLLRIYFAMSLIKLEQE
jgi:hypothetical protein